MHDLNLDEMMVPRYAPPLQPTGKLKVQFQFAENRTTLTVIIIEVSMVLRWLVPLVVNAHILLYTIFEEILCPFSFSLGSYIIFWVKDV